MHIVYNKGFELYTPFDTKKTLGVIVSKWNNTTAKGQYACSVQTTSPEYLNSHAFGKTITADSEEELEKLSNEAKRDGFKKVLKDIDARSRELQRARKEIEKLMNEIPVQGQKTLF